MHRLQIVTAGLVAAGALLLAAPAARADAPVPVPGEPGCLGRIVAITNHISGVGGPSGNPQASTGPGFFLQEQSPEAIALRREFFC